MKSLLSSSLGRQSPSFTQRMEAKKRQEGEEEARKRQHSSSPQQRMGLSSSYNGPSTLRSFLYSSSSSPAQTIAHETPALSDEDSSSMETMVVIEGFLTKQGQRFKTWKRRWCVVLADPPASRSGTPNVERRDDLYEDGERQPLGRKAKLYYAKQPQSRSSRGEVTLDHFSVLDISTGSLDEEAMALQPSDLMPTSHCFCVNTQKRVYYFCCDTAEDLVRWQRALQSLTPHNQNRSDDDAQQRQPRLEREVRHLLRDLCEVMRDHDVDGGNGNGDDDGSSHVDGADDSDPEEAQDYVAKGKEAVRDGSFSPGSQKKQKQKKKGNRKEEKRREKERKWLRVIEAEVQQAETIEDEDERWEEWVRLKQALTKGMERALLHSDQRRAELTLRAAAAKASSMMADGSTSTTSDESEGEAAKKQKNESDGAAATKERRSENGAAGRRREGTRRAGGRDEDDQDDGWNSDGFDTSREATLAREIMGQRADDSGHRDDEGLYGDDSDGGLLDDDAQQGESDDTEDEEDGLLESDKRRHAKRKRKSRRGRKKAPTRRIYSYGQEESIGFEGEPETERSFAAGGGGGGGTYGTYGAQRKSGDDDGHQRDFDPTRTSSSFSFWSCFCC